MQRWAAFARNARNYNYISSSSSRIPNRKVSFSVSSNLLLRSSTSCNSSSSPQFLLYISNKYNYLPPPRFFSQKITASKNFQKLLSFLSNAPTEGYQIKPTLSTQHQQHRFVLKIIEASSKKIITETPNVSPHYLIHFVKLAWKKKKKNNNNNKSVIITFTTPVLESLVSAICTSVDVAATESDLRRRKSDVYFLWDLVKHIGHNQSGVLNVRILNQLILSFADLGQQGKAALEVFNKFEDFQCVPNQDTYDFTLQALCCCPPGNKRFLYPTAASSLCQKMLLHPETLLPDDGEKVGDLLSFFSSVNLPNEAYALYLAVNEKRKRNRNWSLRLHMLMPMVREFSQKKETVQLALEMLTDTDIPEEVEEWENGFKERMCLMVLESLCCFKYFDEAKQLIFKMIADGPLPPPDKVAFNIIIVAYIKAGEMGQALEMVMLLESIGLYTCDALMCFYSLVDGGMKVARKILEEVKKKQQHSSKLIIPLEYHSVICGYCKLKQFDDDYSKLIIPQLYHILICRYCKLKQFDKALKLLTQMKDFGVSRSNIDEYDKLIHSLRLDPAMDWEMAEEQLHEMIPNIRGSF